MKETPVLMSAPMVRAILEGRKTQTRRVVKPQPDEVHDGAPFVYYSKGGIDRLRVCDWPYQMNDRLWVRETWYNDIPDGKDVDHVYFRADGECCQQIPECACATMGKPKWRPSIFMPKWACRLWLEVVSVRVDRLQEISEEDARAEGVRLNSTTHWATEARDALHVLWDSLKPQPGFAWADNPFVWVVEFKRVERSQP